jgi:signal transduction histidine kinase/ligand-binding sensor domain-containing protein
MAVISSAIGAEVAPGSLGDVSHSSWTARDGAPSGITAMAQTTDGYLWLGTPLGLSRFDGLRFTSFPFSSADPALPQQGITSLSADHEGGLWIGYAHGGISHLVLNRIANYTMPGVQRDASVDFLSCCEEDSVWVITGRSIMRLHDFRWEEFGAQRGLPADRYFTLFFDREGDIWTASRHHVFVLRAGGDRFSLVNTDAFSVTQFAQSRDGTMWMSDGWRGVRPVDSHCAQPSVALRGTANMLIDPEDRIWLGRDYRGVTRTETSNVGCGQALEQSSFGASEGLSSDETRALLRDRDGNIWVGTERGLDRFRSRMFKLFNPQPFSFYPAVAEAGDGGIWIDMHAKELVHFTRSGEAVLSKERHGSSPLAADGRGGVWLRDPWDHRLHHFDEEGRDVFQAATPASLEDTAAQSIVVLGDGSLLVAFEEQGLWKFKDAWEKVSGKQFPDETPTCLASAGTKIWIGYSSNRIASYADGAVRLYGAGEGVTVESALTIVVSGSTTWVGGSNGVAFLSGYRIWPLVLRQPELAKGVSGLVFDGGGNLWLNAGAGVVMIRSSEVRQVLSNPRYAASAVLYGEADGIVGSPAQAKPLPSALKDGSGRLWFATAGNLVYLPPDGRTIKREAPTVGVFELLIDGRPVPLRSSANQPIEIAGGHDNQIEVDYAATDLSVPTQVQYRYRLEHEEPSWHSVGGKRQAFYARLRPGSYRFRVQASNSQDQWRESAHPLYFRVKPAFYQTAWFATLGIALVLLLLRCLYLMRVRFVTAQIRSGLENRADERVRIARELHDTLLQSIQGLLLRFHFATEALDANHPAVPMLKAALERADRVMLEGRNRVCDLRGEQLDDQTLVEGLTTIVQELSDLDSPPITIAEEGAVQPLHPEITREICKIVREAILNALSHSGASQIEVTIGYGQLCLSVCCRDNGIGIPQSILASGGCKGHWGLRGMRERAEAIEAKLTLSRGKEEGTCVRVELPASIAYRKPMRFRWRSQRLRGMEFLGRTRL